MDKLNALIVDETIIYQGVTRTAPDLQDAFPDVWGFEFTAEGGVKELRDGTRAQALESEFDALVAQWESAAPEPAPERSLEEVRDQARSRVQNGMRSEVGQSVTDYPPIEIESWPQQEQEARALLDNPSADPQTIAPLVAMIADEGETPADVANNIVTKAQEFRGIIGPAIRKRRQKYAAIETAYQAGDRAALEAIDWS